MKSNLQPWNVYYKYGARLYGHIIRFGKEETKSTCDTTRQKKIQFESDVTFFLARFYFSFRQREVRIF